MYFEVSKLVWTLFTLTMTLLRIQSAYFTMMWVLFPLMGRTLLEKIYDQDGVKKVEKGKHIYQYNKSFVFDVLI